MGRKGAGKTQRVQRVQMVPAPEEEEEGGVLETRNCVLVIDARETALIAAFQRNFDVIKRYGISWRTAQLDVGDIVFYHGNNAVLQIERKASAENDDLKASVCDTQHRWSMQRDRLLATGVRTVLLLEGEHFDEALVQCIETKCLLEDNIHVVRRDNVEQTRGWLCHIARCLNKGVAYRHHRPALVGQKRSALVQSRFVAYALAQVDGITLEKAYGIQCALAAGLGKPPADVTVADLMRVWTRSPDPCTFLAAYTGTLVVRDHTSVLPSDTRSQRISDAAALTAAKMFGVG